MPARASFREHYGPWALIAGAAVGLGAEYARQIAAKGLDLVLVDRDDAPLRATADAIASTSGVRTLPVVAELGRADVGDVLANAVGDRGRAAGLQRRDRVGGALSQYHPRAQHGGGRCELS